MRLLHETDDSTGCHVSWEGGPEDTPLGMAIKTYVKEDIGESFVSRCCGRLGFLVAKGYR